MESDNQHRGDQNKAEELETSGIVGLTKAE